MTRPRIAFWSPLLYRAGGTETWHCALLPRIDRSRFDVIGLGVLNPEEFDAITAAKIARHCPVVCGDEALADLASRADLLVMWGIAYPEQILRPDAERPIVVNVSHGDGTSDFTVSVMEASSPCTDRFVAVSKAARHGIPRERWPDTRVIPSGIDPDRLIPQLSREEQRRLWRVPDGCKVLGYLGRASEEKNPTALAAAIKHLPPEWVGVFVGDGIDFPNVRAHAFAAAGTRVYFPGVVEPEDVGAALAAFDVLLVPSHQEGYCQTLVEGWMAGVPVASTLVGVAREHPEWVWQLPMRPNGPDIDRAVRYADRPTFRRVLPEIARLAHAEYGADRMARDWESFLLETLHTCRSARSRSSLPSATA